MNLKELHFNTLNIEKNNRTIKHNFKAAYCHYEDQDQDTLIEQSPVTNTVGKIQCTLTKHS